MIVNNVLTEDNAEGLTEARKWIDDVDKQLIEHIAFELWRVEKILNPSNASWISWNLALNAHVTSVVAKIEEIFNINLVDHCNPIECIVQERFKYVIDVFHNKPQWDKNRSDRWAEVLELLMSNCRQYWVWDLYAKFEKLYNFIHAESKAFQMELEKQ